jgi:hypothetical protein
MRKLAVLLVFALLLIACDSEPEKPKEGAAKTTAPKTAAAQYETGRVAFQKVFIQARGWAKDAQPVRLESQYTKDAPADQGKEGVWTATFASPGNKGLKPFTWSGVKSDDAPPPGISGGTESDFNPANANTQPFDFLFLKQDSDKAYSVAQAHGGDKIMKKDPKTPVNFVLDWWPKENKLKWHVIYGNQLRVAVDATTGDFLKVEK